MCFNFPKLLDRILLYLFRRWSVINVVSNDVTITSSLFGKIYIFLVFSYFLNLYFLSKMPKITKFRPHLLKLFRENYWLLFSGYGVYTVPQVKPLLARLKTKLLEALRPEQSGFTPNGSIVDRIIALNTLLQTCREFNKPLWIACRLEVSLHLKSLWLLLSIPDKMVEVLKELSTETCSLCFGRWSTV